MLRLKSFVLQPKRATNLGISLVVQWLKLHTPITENPGSVPGEGSRSYMPQLKDPSCSKKKLKIPHAAAKTQYSQPNNLKIYIKQKNHWFRVRSKVDMELIQVSSLFFFFLVMSGVI